MLGVSGSLSGVLVNSHIHIVVRNGSVSGWGIDGVDGSTAGLARIDDLRADANAGAGISINSGSQVNNCVAAQNGGVGMGGSNDVLVTGCVSSLNGSHGFQFGGGSILKSCLAYNNSGAGITTSSVSSLTVIDCNAHFNTGFGISGPETHLCYWLHRGGESRRRDLGRRLQHGE